MTRILVVDNYDSFVHTIVDYLQCLGARTHVVRNDAVPADLAGWDGVLVSPGPGAPSAAGDSVEVIRRCADAALPMLGVCLGHQALAEAFGARVVHAPELVHGRAGDIRHDGTGVFASLPSPVRVTRYHSLAVAAADLPAAGLRATAWAGDGDRAVVMGLSHATLPLHGVQFHPESVLTVGGHRMLANWLAMTGDAGAPARSTGMAPLVSAR